MQLFAIALLSQLSTAPADPCTQLNAAYEELELMDEVKGEEAKKRAGKLVEFAAQCRGRDGGQRKSLEGYWFAFSILQTEDSLPSSYCVALQDANGLAQELTKSAPNNARIAALSARLAALVTNTTCDQNDSRGLLSVASGNSAITPNKGNDATSADSGETDAPSDEHSEVEEPKNPAQFGNEEPGTGESEEREVEGPIDPTQPRDDDRGPAGQHSSSNLLHLERGVIGMGVVSGVSLVASGILQGVTYAESVRVSQALDDDKPPLTETDPCILGNVEQGADAYCGKLNNLKVATIVSWSLTGASALTTVALGIVYAKKRKSQRTVALAPKLQLGRHGVIWGVGGRF